MWFVSVWLDGLLAAVSHCWLAGWLAGWRVGRPAGATPLLRACGSGAVGLVGLLLELRANPNIANDKGLTPLDATKTGNAEAQYILANHLSLGGVGGGCCRGCWGLF